MFKGNVPCELKAGDKVHVHGVLNEGAKVFSINFVNDASNQNISYHFKYNLEQQLIQQSHKWHGQWQDHGSIPANSLDGLDFAFEFSLQDDMILVYSKYEDSFTLMCQFELINELRDIQRIEVWGDVSKVNQLSFFF